MQGSRSESGTRKRDVLSNEGDVFARIRVVGWCGDGNGGTARVIGGAVGGEAHTQCGAIAIGVPGVPGDRAIGRSDIDRGRKHSA